MSLFPFLPLIAIVTSAVLLIVLWSQGDVGQAQGTVLLGFVLLGACLQFVSEDLAWAAAGLVVQTAVACYLILRWKFAS